MVSGLRIDGATQILPARVRKTIQSIKEIVGNHSDADIYTTLKETNMDPNETAQKLLNQDPFREVKRRRDKKKENMGYKGSLDTQRHSEDVRQGTKVYTLSDRNVRRGAYAKSSWPGISKEFRIVRDNRVNRNTNREVKPASPHLAISTNEVSTNVSKSGISPTGAQGPSGGRISQLSFRKNDSHPNSERDGYLTEIAKKELREDVGVSILNSVSDTLKPNDSEEHSAVLASNGTAVGLYSSSTDPVHVPSPDSRSSAAVGAIKREVGAVGVRRQLKESSTNQSSGPSVSLTNSVAGRDGSSTDSFRPLSSISKGEHLSQITEPVIPGLVSSRSTLNNQHSSRQHQPTMGHQKASQPNKEWKPKSSQKSSSTTSNPGVIGTPSKSKSTDDEFKELPAEAANVQDKLARVDIHENQSVIIAEHIRVPDTDQYRLVFGSFGAEADSSGCLPSGFQPIRGPEELNVESSASQLASAPEISTDDASGSRQVDLLDDQVQSSESNSPDSGTATELPSADKREPSSPQTLDTYAEIGLVRDRSPKYAPSQNQDPTELPGFSAYDPQTGYDIPYFRPTVDETVRVQGLPSQDAVNSHTGNGISASTIPMVQQQQTPVAQMYPQVHVSHFGNLMPYRQFLSPFYVPPMAMPGYSSSPAYPHPSNGNSYLLMPGGSTHMNANNLKYGIQQFKPVPAASPAGFGNFNNPAGFAMNAPGVVGSATGLEDSSRMKYKDGNLYVPNAQAETSEIWIQNPRDLPGLQSTPYYNMPGQTPHGAYLPSHTGHASFSAAVAQQSTHMQFPGLYHPPPQPAAIGNPHHMGPGMGGNVGVGVAAATPGPQVGTFQQPQLGHLNWTTNF